MVSALLRNATRARTRSPVLPFTHLRHPHPSTLAGAAFPARQLHVRSVSIFTGLGRLAGRTAGRGALGLGVGAGALTWAEWKVDGASLTRANWAYGRPADTIR